MLRACMIMTVYCASAFCQELAFTSRMYVQSPVVISSVQRSKDFGFDSLMLRNDGTDAINAVHFQITLRTNAGDEIADERRVTVDLQPRESKRLFIGLAHIDALKDLAKSRKQTSALLILTIESVEFLNGGEWKQTERDRGIPIDPLPPEKPAPRR
jgi:hypothetical protein